MDNYLERIEDLDIVKERNDRLQFLERPLSIEDGTEKWMLIAKAIRKLPGRERILLTVKIFVMTLCTAGFGLLFKSFRDDWSTVFKGREEGAVYVKEELHKDPVFMLEAMKTNPEICASYLPGSLRKNDVFMLDAIRQDPGALMLASQSLRDSRAFTLRAVQMNGLALEFVKKNFRRDHSIVMAALTNNGLALKYAQQFKKSHSHVLVAVMQNPAAYEYADDALKRDPKIVLAAGLIADPL